MNRLLRWLQKTEVEDLTTNFVAQLPDTQLLGWHYRLHQLWGTHQDSSGSEFQYVQPHSTVVDEMIQRGFKHLMVDELDQYSGRIHKTAGVLDYLTKTSNLKPFDEFLPPKPEYIFYAADDKGLIRWFQQQTHKETRTTNIFVEPKYNGLRTILHHQGNRLAAVYEDATRDRSNDILGADPRLQAWHKLPDCVLDGDLCVLQGGKRWNRAQMMTFLTDNPSLPAGATVHYTAYDLLFWQGTAWNRAPFWRRRAALEQLTAQLRPFFIAVTPDQVAKSPQEIGQLFTNPAFGASDQAEGIVVKSGDWIYGVGGRDTAGMCKLKRSLVTAAVVISAERNDNGTFTLACGLPAGSYAGKLANLVTVRGQPYVNLGQTHNAAFAAKPGDLVRVRIEELIYRSQPPSLAWTGPTPLEVTEADGTATAETLVARAKEARIYQETGEQIAKATARVCEWPRCWAEATHRLVWADQRGRTYVCDAHKDGMLKRLRNVEASQIIKRYTLAKADDAQRYTLGVAYPADEIDSHGDFASAEDVEKAAWQYLTKARGVGLMHKSGTDGAGVVVESYIYRGPDWTVDDQIVKAGDWLLGVVWDEASWQEIQTGRLRGYSIQGLSLIQEEE